jgi:hypothetical protein
MLSMILAQRLDELEARHAPKGIASVRYEGGQWFQRGELIPDDEVLTAYRRLTPSRSSMVTPLRIRRTSPFS